MLKIIVSRGIAVVGWTVSLLEVSVFLSLTLLGLQHSSEVCPGKHSVLGHPVVHGSGLEVMKMLEVRGIGVSDVEGHEGVAIVDSVAVLAVDVVQNIVLDNGVLSHGGDVGPGGIPTDAVTESKDVLMLIVLESVSVNVDKSGGVGETGLSQEVMGL